MKFQQRIALDRFIAVPLAVFINAFVRLAGFILRRDHSVNPETTRQIVVCKLVGMGSILQATPFLRSLKEKFPNARLTLLTLESNRMLASRLASVDTVLCLNDSSAFLMLQTTIRIVFKLIRQRIDHFFDLEIYSGFSCLLSVFSLSKNRFGFYRHSGRFKNGIYTHLVYFNTQMPVRKTYLQLGCAAGVSAEADDNLESVRVEPQERLAVREKLLNLGLNQTTDYLVLNPNASDLMLERRWPDSHVVSAITMLREAGCKVVIVGSPSETGYVQSIINRLPTDGRDGVFDMSGKLSLGELFALIESAACVLTNDTGPMHIAFSLNVPTVCQMGPSNPLQYGIERPGVITLYAPVPCSPCIHETDRPPCGGDNFCMKRLSPKIAVENVLKLIKAKAEGVELPGGLVCQPLTWHNLEGAPLGVVPRHTPSRKQQIRPYQASAAQKFTMHGVFKPVQNMFLSLKTAHLEK